MNWFKGPNNPKGYSNIGSSCYMNSVLQCLKYCDAFIEELKKINPPKGSFVDIFKRLMLHDQLKASETFNLLCELKTSFKKYKEYQNIKTDQEDANEFLLFILGQLHKDLLDNTKAATHDSKLSLQGRSSNDNKLTIIKSDSSVIGDLFIGLTKHVVKCCGQCCDKYEDHYQFFFCLNIPIIGSKNVYFDDCYSHFVEETITDSKNEVMCDKCLKSVSMMLQTTISKYPEYLIIHLQRAIFNESIKTCSKEVICPVILMIPKSKTEYIEYTLSSFINYTGNAKYGHYTSTCKVSEKQWIHFDDAKSSKCSSINRNLHRAYILFYKKQSYN